MTTRRGGQIAVWLLAGIVCASGWTRGAAAQSLPPEPAADDPVQVFAGTPDSLDGYGDLTTLSPASTDMPPADPLIESWHPESAAALTCECPNCLTAEAAEGFWYSGAELTWFEPRYEVTSPASFWLFNSVDHEFDAEDAVGPRVYVGWESAAGLGLRTRAWWFESDRHHAPYWTEWSLQLARGDLDLYRRFRFAKGSLVVGGDLALVDLELEDVAPDSPHTQGGGLGLFLEGRHDLYQSPHLVLACVGRGRWTHFFAGETDYIVDMTPGGLNSPLFAVDVPGTRSVNMQATEAAAGLELVRKFARADFALEWMVEVQGWEVSPVSELSFFGSTFAASLRL
jgi:hypothetical protein